MGAKYTHDLTRDVALQFLRSYIEQAPDSMLEQLVEIANDELLTVPSQRRAVMGFDLCNFRIREPRRHDDVSTTD